MKNPRKILHRPTNLGKEVTNLKKVHGYFKIVLVFEKSSTILKKRSIALKGENPVTSMWVMIV